MKALHRETIGHGDRHLVLLHGWGLNAGVWHCISDRLSAHFCLHLVDLPGYGRSQGYPAMTLDEMAATVVAQAPEQAIWLGWSLGGLVASQIALDFPQRVSGLISVASSPRFSAEDSWPGIKSETLSAFQQQLSEDFQRTVERFLALQTLGTESARQDARALKSVVFERPMPAVEVLNGGLEILKTADLRQALVGLPLPFLRLYGALDGLVPRKIVPLLDGRWPDSRSHIIARAAHAPFISHPAEFCQQIIDFSDAVWP
ncbi:pimeloyl-ACP methyl ester esterase BioH [Erwinia sorbitola]|uniref:Pimeloyl-[acyl-carrier protein] methyl ester esterase n=1 Tax=Erwinia sorbitola TaxID=2681984 RepID=A0A6I6EDP6_9GAMM|nr:pimeloyl-ACP methyl ester esterase BioH [Erwinia sorbitola]MTD29130.1 pimeloyl-ACP methyl ester esterase BioH [Erwinia sorbitola]QGU85975.1 pimeloyl-ACP methyl ester esterase BioH [Erwinia sorbitola]